MNYTKSVFIEDGNWEYDILTDGVVIIHQDFDPDMEGLTPMSENRANEAADVVLLRLRG